MNYLPDPAREVEMLRARIDGALAEMDASTYGDPEVPFRMRAHLDPENRGVTFNVAMTKVPVRP